MIADELLPLMIVPAVIAALDALDTWPTDERDNVRDTWRADALDMLDGSGPMADCLFGHASAKPTRKDRQQVADAFAVLARGLAAMAHAPGGVEFAGTLWCAAHHRLGTSGPTPCQRCVAQHATRLTATPYYDPDPDTHVPATPVRGDRL